MTYLIERERRIEELLVDEFRREGFSVEDRDGHKVGFVPVSDDGDGTRTLMPVDLTMLASRLHVRLIA